MNKKGDTTIIINIISIVVIIFFFYMLLQITYNDLVEEDKFKCTQHGYDSIHYYKIESGYIKCCKDNYVNHELMDEKTCEIFKINITENE